MCEFLSNCSKFYFSLNFLDRFKKDKYNDFKFYFVYGKTGSGKTTLIQSLSNEYIFHKIKNREVIKFIDPEIDSKVGHNRVSKTVIPNLGIGNNFVLIDLFGCKNNNTMEDWELYVINKYILNFFRTNKRNISGLFYVYDLQVFNGNKIDVEIIRNLESLFEEIDYGHICFLMTHVKEGDEIDLEIVEGVSDPISNLLKNMINRTNLINYNNRNSKNKFTLKHKKTKEICASKYKNLCEDYLSMKFISLFCKEDIYNITNFHFKISKKLGNLRNYHGRLKSLDNKCKEGNEIELLNDCYRNRYDELWLKKNCTTDEFLTIQLERLEDIYKTYDDPIDIKMYTKSRKKFMSDKYTHTLKFNGIFSDFDYQGKRESDYGFNIYCDTKTNLDIYFRCKFQEPVCVTIKTTKRYDIKTTNEYNRIVEEKEGMTEDELEEFKNLENKISGSSFTLKLKSKTLEDSKESVLKRGTYLFGVKEIYENCSDYENISKLIEDMDIAMDEYIIKKLLEINDMRVSVKKNYNICLKYLKKFKIETEYTRIR